MSGRYPRNSAILAKIEVTEGIDPIPTGAANAMLVTDITVNPLNAQNVDRDFIRNYFGASEQLVGTSYVELSFGVELAGSGVVGTAPKWGPLLQACGCALTTNLVFVSYQPAAPGAQSSVTIYYYDDGVLHKLLGAKGTLVGSAMIGERPMLKFSFTGIDGGVTAAVNPTTTLTGFSKPPVVTNANTGDLLLGCTYALGALSAGTSKVSRGLSLDFGNAVAYTPLLGADYIDITDRAVTGKVQLDLAAAAEVSFMTDVKANLTQSVGLEHGTVAGNIVGFYMPAVQFINPTKEEVNGRRLIGADLRSVPLVGNDDVLIYCK